jgi:hypothetical protein
MTTPTTVPVRLKLRQDTAANWTSVNPTLLAGELGRESDTGKIKIGNGSSTWTALAYQPFGSAITNADIAANAEIAVSKLADGAARQLLQTAANGTDVEWASNIDIPGTLDVTGAATFDGAVTIEGDLTVNGTETIINTQTLTVEDKNIELGKIDTPTDALADGGGITLKGTTDKTINWVDATDAWTFSEHVNIASAKEYRIAGTKVLDATSLGSAVVTSSLTSVGTISTGVWQGTAIDKTYLDATLVSTGDTGTVTSTMIADGTIVDADVNASAAIAGTKIAPNFGSQNVVTTGTNTAASLIPTGSTVPTNGVYLPSANTVGVATNGTERARIDSSGRLLVGTSTARANFFNTTIPSLSQVESSGEGLATASFTHNANSTTGAAVVLAKTRGAAAGSTTIVQSGDVIGNINFQGSDGTEFVAAAWIRGEVDGTPGTDDMPGRLVFSTTADGASSPTERMRIQARGDVLINTLNQDVAFVNGVGASFNPTGVLELSQNGSAVGRFNRKTSDGAILNFSRDATIVGSISVTTTATAYNTSSDYRLKENVTAVTDGITRLQQLKPSRFNFIADLDTVVDGFLAHEVQDVVPEAITGEKDAVDDEGNPEYQGIDQSKLVPLLTAALQEAIAKIESLEARLTAAGI